MIWRGVVYGAADGLLLSSFPILAVFAAFAGTALRTQISGKLRIGASRSLASLAMTAAYHAGYSDFRSGKIANPIAGDVIWSVPDPRNAQPDRRSRSPTSDCTSHAVLHSYHTDLFLPPHE